MARISTYINNNSGTSAALIAELNRIELPTLESVESFQAEYGVSDQMLASMLRGPKSWVSQWKSGEYAHLQPYKALALHFAMEFIKKNHSATNQ